MASQPHVFISYATDTKPLAEELTRVLQREGIHAWADFKDLKPGQIWKEEIEQALKRAQSFVILLSPESQASRWNEAEWRAALASAWSDSDKRIFPVMIGGSEPPPFLRDWVSLNIDPNAPPEQWTSQVLRVLRSEHHRRIRGLGNRDKQQRRERLDELERAAEEWRRREFGPDYAKPDSQP